MRNVGTHGLHVCRVSQLISIHHTSSYYRRIFGCLVMLIHSFNIFIQHGFIFIKHYAVEMYGVVEA